MVVLAYQNLWVDYLVWVNSLVNFYGLICLVWIYFCVVGVVFVMGWGMFKEVLINLGLIFFFFSLKPNMDLLFVLRQPVTPSSASHTQTN